MPQCLDQFPEIISMIFGKSPIVIATMVAFILNIILPNKTLQDEENERIQMDAN